MEKEISIKELAEAVNQIAQTQNSGGEWSVNGAAFIIIALFGILILGTVFSLLIRSVINQQKQLIEKSFNNNDLLHSFNEAFTENIKVLEKVSAYLEKIEKSKQEIAKTEGTNIQLHYFIVASLETYKFKIILNTKKIIEENNIANKTKTKNKIDSLLNNLYNNLISSLNSFTYSEVRVGESLFENNWRDSQYILIQDYIYSEKRDLNKFMTDLNILFDSIFQEIKQKVNF